MRNTYDTIIIGSGCGGAAATALMSYLGDKTLLIEKNRQIGGRAALFEKDGFKLDHGHVLARCDKGPHGQVLRIVKCSDLIPKFSYLDNWAVQGRVGDSLTDVYPSMRSMILRAKAHRASNIKVTFKEALSTFNMVMRQYLMTEKQIKKYDHMDLKTYLSGYRLNPYMNKMFEGLSVGIFGAPAWEASAGEVIRIFRHVYRDMGAVGYPANGEGVSAVPKSFIRAAERLGAEIMTEAPVEKIIIENGRAKGVIVKGEKILADRVISNAGIMPTVCRLAGEEHFEKSYVDRIKNLKYSCSGLSFKFALKKKITDYTWGGEIPDNVEKSYLDMTQGRNPDKFIVMFIATSNIDPSLAPPGCQTISCISGGPVLEPGKFDWSAWMKLIRKQIEDLLPGINENILFCKEENPDHIAKFNGRIYGDAVGVAQTVDQIGHLRPSMISPLKGLYHVGADVGWGHMATEAATFSAIELYKHFKGKKKK